MLGRSPFSRLFLLSVIVVAGACNDGEPISEASSRPNVLMIISDDQAPTDLGAYGNPNVRTPNMDTLAREGMAFDRAFAPVAMCSPSRSSLYTGLWPIRNGAHRNHTFVLEGTRGLPQYFSEIGYRVALAGKTHVGPAESFPFEFMPGSGIGPGGVAIDGQLEAIREVIADDRQPFFMVVASRRPHAVAGEEGGWPTATTYEPASVLLPPYMVDTEETRIERAGYYELITELDTHMGTILGYVEEEGKTDDTIVMFMSDHGAGFAFEKWTNYDAGLRVPMIVKWPGRIDAGTRTSAAVSLVDVLPTLFEIAGGPMSEVETLDGQSFAPVLLDGAPRHRALIYGLHSHLGVVNGGIWPIRSVRDDRFRYIRNLRSDSTFTNNVTERGNGGWFSWVELAATDDFAAGRVLDYQTRPTEELYDLDADPYELTNLADDPEHRQTLLRLRRELDAWMESQGDRGRRETDPDAAPWLPPEERA